jgi:hypothetical protein
MELLGEYTFFENFFFQKLNTEQIKKISGLFHKEFKKVHL